MTIGKPGIFIRFGIMMALSRLSDEAAGGLFKQLLVFGKYGVSDHVPPEATALWMLLSSYILVDDDDYRVGSYQSRYQAYVRHMHSGKQKPVLDYNDWMAAYGIYDQEDPTGI